MLTTENIDDTVYVISEDSDEENSLMLKIKFFHKEEDEHMKSMSTKSITTLKDFEEGSCFYRANMECGTQLEHPIKNRLKSRISKATRRVKNQSWLSSRSKLKDAMSKHDQIVEFMNAVFQHSSNIHDTKKNQLRIIKQEMGVNCSIKQPRTKFPTLR